MKVIERCIYILPISQFWIHRHYKNKNKNIKKKKKKK